MKKAVFKGGLTECDGSVIIQESDATQGVTE